MHLTARAWIWSGRLRRKLGRRDGVDEWEARKRLIPRFAPGRSFADVGCMWEAHGEIAFRAEEAGATAVTAFDGMNPTDEYLREHERRNSEVRFVQGDIHDPRAAAEIGEHDVVWCTGLLYHTPNPLLMLERLASITRGTLILATHTIPEIPGVEGACVLYPALSDAGRAAHAPAWPAGTMGVTEPFERGPLMKYANYWWGISRTALMGMLDVSGFEPLEVTETSPFSVDVVARRAA
jgi:hypothetical protein